MGKISVSEIQYIEQDIIDLFGRLLYELSKSYNKNDAYNQAVFLINYLREMAFEVKQ